MSQLFQIICLNFLLTIYLPERNCLFFNKPPRCNFSGRQPMPNNCRYFLECKGWPIKHEKFTECEHDYHFSVQHGVCKPAWEAGCDLSYTTTRRTTTTISTITSRPNTCEDYRTANECVGTGICDVCLDDSYAKICSSNRNFNCPQDIRFTYVKNAMKNKHTVRWGQREDEVLRMIPNEGLKPMDLIIPVDPGSESLSMSYSISQRGQLGLVQIIGNNCQPEGNIPANECLIPEGANEVTFKLKLEPDECWESYLEVEVGFEIEADGQDMGEHIMKTYIFCNKELN